MLITNVIAEIIKIHVKEGHTYIDDVKARSMSSFFFFNYTYVHGIEMRKKST